MKTIGIVGGIGPESTVAYYHLILSEYRAQVQDGSYPPVLINSIDLKRMLDLVGAGRPHELAAYLLEEVQRLARAGAGIGCLASNTPHIVFDELERQSPIPLISIVRAACEEIAVLGLKSVGLFGTSFIMKSDVYAEVLSSRGIALVLPGEADQEFIHTKYMNELVHGVVLPETRHRLLQIATKMREEEGIQGLVLGGTELPLILREKTYDGIPFLDTTKIHVKKIVTEMLA